MRIERRGIRFGVLCSIVLPLISPVAAAEAIRAYATLTLKDGRQLTAVEIVRCTASRVLVRHKGGVTSIRTEMMPPHVVSDLDLRSLPPMQPLAGEPALLRLADKVAVDEATNSEMAALAEKPAVAESADSDLAALADRIAVDPFNLPPIAVRPARAASGVFAEHALIAPGAPLAGEVRSTAAEGHRAPGLSRENGPSLCGARHDPAAYAGWMAVTLPSGETHLLAGVEVAAYPADVLTRSLEATGAGSVGLAQQLGEQAAAAAQEGRAAASAALYARAAKTAVGCLRRLPAAPYVTRTDASGRFNLRHDLRDFRLVAVARIQIGLSEWTYIWISVVPGEDALLTEANATFVSGPVVVGAVLAVRDPR
ncbi:MAG: hypothetical protein FJ399_10910 [Verrucomicrobia bacterium]|nr:hypothetical protein [Verrucomicrobiota bacterium]